MSTRDSGNRVREALRKIGDEAGPAPDFEALRTGRRSPRPARVARWLVPAGLAVAVIIGAAVALLPGDKSDDLETIGPPDESGQTATGFATAEDLVAAAEGAGYQARVLDEPRSSDPVVPGRERRVCIASGLVRVFEYETAEARAAISTSISSDGQLPNAQVEWIGAPRFFASGQLIALHLGKASLTTEALERAMGATISASATHGRGSPDFTDSCDEDALVSEVAACGSVEDFAEEFSDTGILYDRGPASIDPSEHVGRSEAVVLGRLVRVEQRLGDSRTGVAVLLDVSDVLWQTSGPPIQLGELAIDQDMARQNVDDNADEALPVGARAVAFMYFTEQLPDGWGFNLEGLWIECVDDEGLSFGGDIIRSPGWADVITIDDLASAVREAAQDE